MLENLTLEKSPLQVVIVADDLTGALDAAGPFAGRGLKTIFVSQLSQLEDALAHGPDVLAFNTNSREISAAEAGARVKALMEIVPKAVFLFKKVDSRLKGNIVAELAEIPFERALVVPAIPKFGRVTEAGCITGFGVETPISISACLGSFAAHSEVPDTLTDEAIQQALLDNEGCDLMIGARGLAEALAQKVSGMKHAYSAPVFGTGLLISAGSRDPITLAQLTGLREGIGDLIDVKAPNGFADLSSIDAGSKNVLLVQATPGIEISSGAEVEEKLARSLCIPNILSRDVMVLTGGATAEAVLRQMGVGNLHIIGEALPGLPVARFEGRTFITKSGGFGDADTLVKIVALFNAA